MLINRIENVKNDLLDNINLYVLNNKRYGENVFSYYRENSDVRLVKKDKEDGYFLFFDYGINWEDKEWNKISEEKMVELLYEDRFLINEEMINRIERGEY